MHLAVSSALGCAGGSRHEPPEYFLTWREYRTAPRLRTWPPPSRERSRLGALPSTGSESRPNTVQESRGEGLICHSRLRVAVTAVTAVCA